MLKTIFKVKTSDFKVKTVPLHRPDFELANYCSFPLDLQSKSSKRPII